MSNVGLWDAHWGELRQPFMLGSAEPYARCAEWVADQPLVEDWGCGPGALRGFVQPPSVYRGVDGSASPFADVHADLTDYRPDDAPSIVMRAVLEHNDNWKAVLDNALESFGKRMIVGLFTPLALQTTVLLREPDFGDVPVISFALADLVARINTYGHWWAITTMLSPSTFYGAETFIHIER